MFVKGQAVAVAVSHGKMLEKTIYTGTVTSVSLDGKTIGFTGQDDNGLTWSHNKVPVHRVTAS
jgi:hypothetical protein